MRKVEGLRVADLDDRFVTFLEEGKGLMRKVEGLRVADLDGRFVAFLEEGEGIMRKLEGLGGSRGDPDLCPRRYSFYINI